MFVGLTGGRGVAVLNATNGQRIRTFTYRQLGIGQQDNIATMTSAGRTVIVASYRRMLAITAGSDHILWRRPGGATSLTVHGNTLYSGEGCQFNCGTPASRAIDLSSGRVLWVHGGNFGGPVTWAQGRLYQPWGENVGTTRVYDPASGRLLQTLPYLAQWTGNAYGSYALVSSTMGQPLHAWLGRFGTTGALRWRVSLGAPLSLPAPVVADGRVYAPSNRFHPGILAVGTGAGHIAWGSNTGAVNALAVAHHLVFTGGAEVDVLNDGTGRLVRRISLPNGTGYVTGLTVSGSSLYALTSGTIVALRSGS